MSLNTQAVKKRRASGPDETLPLVERVLAGEKQAFDQIVRLHEGYVYRTCVAITGNPEDAEEATQDAFVKAYRGLGNFRQESRFTTWLTRIAVNESLQRLRRRRYPESLDAPTEGGEDFMPRQIEDWHPDPEQLYAGEELKRMVEEAVLALPPAYRVVFILRDVCEQSIVETAEALDLTIAATKSRLLRARLMVRERLAEKLQVTPTLRKRFLRAGSLMATIMHSLAGRLTRSLAPGAGKER